MPITCATGVLVLALVGAGPPAFDDRPGQPDEWGSRPFDGARVVRNPPSFVWRPQEGATAYALEIASTRDFEDVGYAATPIPWNVHCPTEELAPGTWWWRVRFDRADGETSAWSPVRRFHVDDDAVRFPLPDRQTLEGRVPDAHPRLFVRPENMPELRALLNDPSDRAFADLLEYGEAILAEPPDTTEPALYGPDMVRGSDPWRAVWWGNRRHTIRVLDSAATLGFLYQVTGAERFGDEARRLLLAAAAWDPKGATGYRYNDEAGMPYAYHFARTYTFIHDRLNEEERDTCRRVMRVRGREMYRHLCPGHLWRPYSSHSNRAWHFLGEVAIAFHGEIPEADDWLWFAVNVFANVYPVWSDADGGWHEGMNYFSSYVGRFTWWADVMREAVDLDAYRLPYFARAGDYMMAMLPPGSSDGGFGDLNVRMTSQRVRPLMATLAAQSGNPYWGWYVDAVGGRPFNARATSAYVDLLRRARPTPEPLPPEGLPTARLFAGTGQSVFNLTLENAAENVRVIFKSSPFGSRSHGYEAQNAFLLMAFGERLLIRSGRRDSYGSAHHREWMWQTKSVNCITVDGKGQTPHSAAAVGAITGFHSSWRLDFVEGEAASAYGGRVDRFTRRMLFVKPDVLLIHDRLETPEPASFEWHLHAPVPFEREALDGDGARTSVLVHNGRAACRVMFIEPDDLVITTTDRFDVPPRPRVELTEYHLTARPTEPRRVIDFLTAIQVWPSDTPEPQPLDWTRDGDELIVELPAAASRVIVGTSPRGAPLPPIAVDLGGSHWTSGLP